jgi:ATP-dependent DNA helicase 2 subunit 2
MDEPEQFNKYLETLKAELFAGKLGGNRRDFWMQLKSQKVGLISFKESKSDQVADISEEEIENVSPHMDTNNSFTRIEGCIVMSSNTHLK